MLPAGASGSSYIVAGSAASLAAAAWSFLRGDPYWVTACVAAPVIVVGGVALMWPYSMLQHEERHERERDPSTYRAVGAPSR